MARCVFFSFHYQRDIFRVNAVRNSFLTKGGYSIAGYQDRSLWEKAKSTNPLSLKRMINQALQGTTVTVVLIGAETANRPWVKYEIEKSLERRNGLLGIHIHNIRDAKTGRTDITGRNPLPFQYSTYNWVKDNGYANFAQWIERAAKQAGKL